MECGRSSRRRCPEALLVRISDLVTASLGLSDDLHFILRGSLSQGLLPNKSDLDFELSSPQHPDGHRDVEQVVLDILAAFGIDAEASAGRPTEPDLHDAVDRSEPVTYTNGWNSGARDPKSMTRPGCDRPFNPDPGRLAGTASRYGRATSPARRQSTHGSKHAPC